MSVQCHRCKGTGEVFVEYFAGEEVYDTCPRCDGEGTVGAFGSKEFLDIYNEMIKPENHIANPEFLYENKPLTFTVNLKK